MAKFCGKCGTKLDETTGLCPNCDIDKIHLSKKEKKKQKQADRKDTQKDRRKSWSLGRKIRNVFLKIILTVFLMSVLIGVVGALEYFEIIDVPIVENLLDMIGLKTYSSDDSEDINFENYKIEPNDADKYFQQSSQVVEEISVNDSNEILTEEETIEILAERGFKDVPITTEYTMDGVFNPACEISDSSSIKHPVYETYYITEKGELWEIMMVNGDVMAIPISYNLQSTLGIQVVISESTSVTSYDSATNKFYKNVPNETVMIVKVVEKVDAETLENLTIEVIDEL